MKVRCPIDRCRHGIFHVTKANKVSTDVASSDDVKVKSEKNIKQEDMIDLCTTDEDGDADGLDRKPAAKRKIKQEVKKEKMTASLKRSTSVKKEKTPEPTTSTHRSSKKSKIVSPLPINIKETSNLKPLFNIGDKVTAAWWHPKLDPNQEGDPNGWYPGTIVASQDIGTSEYGPTRTYHIRYDDGDELENIQDYWVFSRKDYDLSMRSQPNIGVKKRRDKQSNDMWAKKVGWYEINVGGTKKLFSFLSDAMKAYDDHVVQRDDKQTKKSHLNLPENYPSLFPEERKVKVELKHELKGEETDNESDPLVKMSTKLPAAKRRRKEDFWETVADPIDFSRQAFMNNPLFHLNPGIDGTVKHQNLWFSPFLREGIASPGFCRVPYNIASEVSTSSYEQIRDDINDECYYGEGIHSARQVALWLKDATVGSFIIMRHEFPRCPFIPSKLKVNGKYIGPVYVIGVVTKKVKPGSAEERNIQDTQMSEFNKDFHNIHSFCKVKWQRMGMKDTLDDSTKKYINAVCQPTINRMCQDLRKEYKSGATGEAVKRNLWENASIPIQAGDFTDVFDVETIDNYYR